MKTQESPASADSVEVRLFGSLQISVRGRPYRIENEKARELLALLLLSRGPMKKERVAELLWPGGGPQARDNLYKVLRFWQRDQVLQTWLPIESRKSELVLTADHCFCDAWEFDKAFAEKDVRGMEKAVELCADALLREECYDWPVEWEASYEIRWLEMLDALVSHFTSTGDGAKAAYYQKKSEEIWRNGKWNTIV